MVQKGFGAFDARGDLLVEGEAAFGKAAWGLMHEGGSHPGLSDQDTSRFRLLMLTGYARLVVEPSDVSELTVALLPVVVPPPD